LVGIIDDEKNGTIFFGFQIDRSNHIDKMDWDMVLLTRLEDTDTDIKRLLEIGVGQERIAVI